MGYAPSKMLVRFRSSRDPRDWPQHYIDDLLHRMRYRFSWFPSRRRAAYAAVLEVIRWREASLWPEPVAPTNHFLYVSPPEALPCGHPAHRWYPGGCNGCDHVRHPGEPETVTPDGHDWRTGESRWASTS